MSKFKDMMSTQGTPVTYRKIDVWFDCQECDEETNDVQYYPNEKAVVFTCPAGHKNFVENFQVQL